MVTAIEKAIEILLKYDMSEILLNKLKETNLTSYSENFTKYGLSVVFFDACTYFS